MKYLKNDIPFIIDIYTRLNTCAQNPDHLINKERNVYILLLKGTRIIKGHSLQIMFSHRFGTLSEPLYNRWSLDNGANIRFGVDYITTNIPLVIYSRGTIHKAYDGYLKYKILKQTIEGNAISASVSLLEANAMNTLQNDILNNFLYRMYYTTQLLIARKFGSSFSLQFMPAIVHRNFTINSDEKNTIFAIGFGGMAKLPKKLSPRGEYYYNLTNQLGTGYYKRMAFGIGMGTGGHAFQLNFTKTQGIIERRFIGMTSDDILQGFNSIRLGFNSTQGIS